MPQTTSWDAVSSWYDAQVSESGHYYHQHVVLPNALKLLQFQKTSSVLDLACGQGVLARQIPKEAYYQGIDISDQLIQAAKKRDQNPLHHFTTANVAGKSLPIQKKDFTHAALILALQNIEHPLFALQNAAYHLQLGGRLLIVLNHPCFRIPRQSSWEIDEKKRTQFRRIDRYLSPLEIPVTAHPGQKRSSITWSFHQPLSVYAKMLKESGFLIEDIQEWLSDKKSEGKAAKMENRARDEFPLFLAFSAIKK